MVCKLKASKVNSTREDNQGRMIELNSTFGYRNTTKHELTALKLLNEV